MTWWQVFILVAVAIPLMVLWVAIIIDLFRRSDLSGLKIATWVVLLLIFPFIAAITYLVVRPRAPLFHSGSSNEADDVQRRYETQQALTYDTPGGVGPRTTIPPRAR
jgi:hypothetical protein